MGIGLEANTFWGTKEGSNLVVHMDKAGVIALVLPRHEVRLRGDHARGVAVDFADNSLWILDDSTERVYNTQKDGTLIASFPTTGFDANAISCQGIAADPDGTLWLTDNHSWKVYNITKQGALIASFGVAAFDPLATNLQGIGVDDADRSLWLTDRDTHKLYNVTRDGALKSDDRRDGLRLAQPDGRRGRVSPDRDLRRVAHDIADGLAAGSLSSAASPRS
jgi:streptogramin lyase